MRYFGGAGLVIRCWSLVQGAGLKQLPCLIYATKPLRTWSGCFSDQAPITATTVAEGAIAALEAIVRLGRAQPGDKTLVDALDPFARSLRDEVSRGQELTAAWQTAAQAATVAAEATAQLTPKLGRARSHTQRSLGHPDAGAVSLAMIARLVGDLLRQRG